VKGIGCMILSKILSIRLWGELPILSSTF
jgi:hypothetical protein